MGDRNTKKQPLRFGIRQKTVALVLVLSALQVAAVGYYLFRANKAIVVDHELVDLGDEAQLRSWEIADRIDVLKSDLRALALDAEVHETLRTSPNDVERLSELFEAKCQEWNGYCSVTVSPLGADAEAEVSLQTPTVAKLPDKRGSRAALVEEVRNLDSKEVLFSEIVREQAEVEYQALSEVKNRWLPIIWGAVSVSLGEDEVGGAVADSPADAYKIVIALNLDSRSWSTDPRHLAVLVDESDFSYLIHPNMDTKAKFSDDDMFDWTPPAPEKGESVDSDAPQTLVEEITRQANSGKVSNLNDTSRRSLPPVRRIAMVEQVDLTPDFHRFFREGRVTDLLEERRSAINDWQEEVLRDADASVPFENAINLRMRELGDDFAPLGLRVSVPSGTTKTVRILGSTEGDVRKLSDQLVRDLNARLALQVLPSELGVAFPHGTEDRGGPETDLGPDAKTVRWHSIIACRNADFVCVRLRVDGTAASMADPLPADAPMGAQKSKNYWFLYAVFHDELAASVEGELWPAVRRAGLGMVIAGIIAAFVAILSVRPLIRMIQGARYLAALSGKRLHANIRKMAEEIPVDRQDEVGDIARAARKLFGTITENHRELNEHRRQIERHKDELEVKVDNAVAELKTKNAELEAAADEKDKFLASVSHELRTPLTIVAGNLQLLLRKKSLGDRERSYANKSLAASKKLEALIRDLLDIQKIIMGGMSLEPAEFDVPELLAEIEDTLQPQAKKNNNKLSVTCEGIGKVFGDRVRLNQILTNLISNSCKFTQDGSVTIDSHSWTDEGQDWMKFVVTDTGRGMNEEEQQKVFTRFYTNKKANESGTGLGLDICRRLGELMGGHVYLKESAPGKGSVFVVELPQTMMVAGKSSQGAKAGEPKKKRRRDFAALDRKLKDYPVDKGSPPTVLVIDDEPGIQDLMTQHLQGQGYRVIAAESGAKGIEMAHAENPQLITLDVMMDGSDGWEVLQSLKADPVTADIPVVMVTIIDREDKGFALGADDYITKPVDWDHMFSVLGRLTTGGEKHRALVVDDDEGARQLFCSVLAKAGWEISEAEHGGQALERIRERVPSVIVLDLMMPEMDGFEFLEEFKRVPEWQNIPVIVVTAKEMTGVERRKLDESVARVIQKGPQTAGELLDEVQSRASRVQQSSSDESAQ